MYDIFYIGNSDSSWDAVKKKYPYAQILSVDTTINEIQTKSFTKHFWTIFDDFILTDFNLNDYRVTEWDKNYVHVFKNGNFNDGVCLIGKDHNISQREFSNRFFSNKKDIDIVASTPKSFDIYQISTYEDYIDACISSSTNMFYVVWDDIKVHQFNFDFQVARWDQSITHVFMNDKYYDGLCLFSKNTKISKKEFDNRFFINKKEVKILASMPRPYDKFFINNYDEYNKAALDSTTDMFWAIFDDLIVKDDFKFDYYIPKYDSFHRNITHVFKNDLYYDGICLFSKNNIVTKKEFTNRFFTQKKEIDIVASQSKHFDIVFISYFESFAEENFKKLQNKINRSIIRVDGVKGIHHAHKAAANLVSTSMFWVVDADATIMDDFLFDYQVPKYEQDIVHVWKSKNPVNGLEYGNGGVKLLPTKATLEMEENTVDMTTSISNRFKLISKISNIASFNTDPFNSWKSAFRECVKLSSKIIKGQIDTETENRLMVWTTETIDKFALDGAIYGKFYGTENLHNLDAIKKINDFDWLKQTFDERFR